jgi:dUTP pyrophosphatase
MPEIKVKKLHPDAVIPAYAKEGDAAMDLTAVSRKTDSHGNISYGIGLAMEIPKGFCGLLFPRSSVSKQDLMLANCVGVIDSGYRGEVMLKFKTTPADRFGNKSYAVGDRVGQIMLVPVWQINFKEVEELSDSDRGEGGFGYTGK